MIDTELKDKAVLVTGANNPQGIGAATARAFAAEGARVFVTYLRLSPQGYGVSEEEMDRANTPGLEFYLARWRMPATDAVQSIRDSGGRAELWEADLADPTVIPHLFDRAEGAFGPVEVLIHNAAHWKPDTFIPPGQGQPEGRQSPTLSTRPSPTTDTSPSTAARRRS